MTVPPLAPTPPVEAGTSIELFTGGGGLALAMHEAGFRHLLAVELDARACQTLRLGPAVKWDPEAPLPAALGDRWPLFEGDVGKVGFEYLKGQVDVVAGGVPCQPWSLGGAHKGYEDKRNLWPELFRCVREARPKAIVAENVKGLERPSFRPYYEYILRELSAPFEERVEGEDWRDHDRRLAKILAPGGPAYDPATRYHVKKVAVNAADYGVPQVRHRVFVVAFREDLGLGDWEFPAPTHSEVALWRDQASGAYWKRHGIAPREGLVPAELPRADGLRPWRTLRDALSGLPEPLEPLEAKLEADVLAKLRELTEHLENREFRKASTALRQLWVLGNGYLTEAAPWTAFKTDPERAAVGVRTGLNLVALFAKVAEPFIPFAAETIALAVGEGFPGRWPSLEGPKVLDILPAGRPVKAPEVLFRKIEDTQVAEWRERFGGPEAG